MDELLSVKDIGYLTRIGAGEWDVLKDSPHHRFFITLMAAIIGHAGAGRSSCSAIIYGVDYSWAVYKLTNAGFSVRVGIDEISRAETIYVKW